MKKKLCFLAVLFCLLIFGVCNNVNAAEINVADVPNNTYIIGTHMFTDKLVLTTKHIMLGATTIDSDKLEDMIIYYRTPRGAWIDGLTGDPLTPPTTINIEYKDLLPIVLTPKITIEFGGSGPESLGMVIKTEKMEGKGIEVYASESKEGEYTLINKKTYEEMTTVEPLGGVAVEIPAGKHYFYKVRCYNEINGETIYSDYSNIVDCDNTFKTPKITSQFGGAGPEFVDMSITIENGQGKGMEVYYSESEEGEYTLTNEVTFLEPMETVSVKVPAGKHYFFKIRCYNEINGETIYSDFSNVISIDNTFKTPKITSQFGGAGPEFVDMSITIENGQGKGMEVYYSESEEGEYTLTNEVTFLEPMETVSVKVPAGKHYFFKVRCYNEINGETIYSDFSNVISIDNSFNTPKLDIIRIGESENGSRIIAFDTNGEYLGKGIELYHSNTEDGEYTLMKRYEFETSDDALEVEVTKYEDHFFKVRYYNEVNGETIYSEFSNVVSKEHSYILGDVNQDGEVSLLDSTLILQYVAKYPNLPDTFNAEYGDVNQDGVTDEIDADIIANYKNGNITILPYTEGKVYNIIYDLAGGKFETYARTKYARGKNGEIITELPIPDPIREGYIFIGWTGSNGTTPQKGISVSSSTTGDLHYVANWALLGDVNQDGTINSVDSRCVLQYVAGEREPSEKFVVECADANQDGVVDDIDADIILARGAGIISKLPYDSGEKYNITYDLAGGKFNDYARSKYANISILSNYVPEPVKEGYVFIGWTGSNGTTPQKSISVSSSTTGDLHYVANWALLGDVNQDGIINSVDSKYVQQYVAGERGPSEIFVVECADANQDGVVDDIDADIILKYAAGVISKLPYKSGQ